MGLIIIINADFDGRKERRRARPHVVGEAGEAEAALIYPVKQRAFVSSCLQGAKIEKWIDCAKQTLTHL